MSTVIFFGAGSSIKAGYPPTKDLLKELENKYSQSCGTDYKDKWRQVAQYIKKLKMTKVGNSIIESKNIELILSLPDLIAQADIIKKRDLMEEAEISLGKSSNEAIKKIDKAIEIDEKSKKFKNNLTSLLDDYFGYKFSEDKDKSTSWNYLTEILKRLNSEDHIISTNWDLLLETALVHLKTWSPSDGYGFPITFEQEHLGKRSSISLPTSKIKLHKLHGSAGWRLNHGNELYLHYSYFLQYLLPLIGPCYHSIYDANESTHPPTWPENEFLIYPSFLKQLENNVIKNIWNNASRALLDDKTKKIFFIGYSLPESDIAVRVLLNPIREKLQKEIFVIDPSQDTLDRFIGFLGDRIKTCKVKTEEINLTFLNQHLL